MSQGFTQQLSIPLSRAQGGTGAVLTLPVITKVNTQTITATGAFSYTPTQGTQYAIFEIQGGGSGSGGTTGAGGQTTASGGGGGGGYQRILVTGTANLAAITGSVGIAGTAGTSGNNAGGNGGNTTLTINGGTQWVAGGAVGGAGQTSSAAIQQSSAPGAGGSNTLGTNGTSILNIGGVSGEYTLSFGNAGYFIMAHGGGSQFGQGGTSNASGSGYGAGGSGFSNVTGANAAGIAGTQGVVVVTEFISI